MAEGSGPDERPYLHVIVEASDPDPTEGTWSGEAVFALRSRVGELAIRSPVELPQVIVDVYPESADEGDSESESESESDDQDSALAQDLDDSTR